MDCKCLADYLTAGITFLGVIVAIISFFIALKQYIDGNRFKRASYFMELRERFKNNKDFTNIREKIENKQNLYEFTLTQRYDYVGFFEELQIAINSGFIDAEKVYYLFGHYIIDCDNAKLIDRDAPLWSAFKELATNMKSLESYEYNNTLKF